MAKQPQKALKMPLNRGGIKQIGVIAPFGAHIARRIGDIQIQLEMFISRAGC